MAQILHKRATTTHAIRTEIQRSTASISILSKRYNINPNTVRKWRHRDTVEDTRMGSQGASFHVAYPAGGGCCGHLSTKDSATAR